MTKEVFISYSSKEQEKILKICDSLEKKRVGCWIAPRDVIPGESYARQIVQAIKECSIFILIISEEAAISQHVNNELNLAFDNRKLIIPFKIDTVTPSDDFMYYMGSKHWIDASADFYGGMEKLLRVVEKHRIQSVEKSNYRDREHPRNLLVDSRWNCEVSQEKYQILGYKDLSADEEYAYELKKELAEIITGVVPWKKSEDLLETFHLMDYLSENWRLIIDENRKLVAYWVFIALYEEEFLKAKEGVLDEKDITLDCIEYIDFPGVYKGYLLLAGTKPNLRTAELVQMLYHSLALHIEYLAKKEIFFDEICAVAESRWGESACKKIGMKEIAPQICGGKVYCCDMTDIEKNRYFSKYRDLKELYKAYFGRGEINDGENL